jgi:hypothetical protein
MQQCSHEDAVRRRVLIRNAEAEVQKLSKRQAALLGAPPLRVSESPQPARAWMDGRRKLSPEAYRQAVTRENKRRGKIMLTWAECWMARRYAIGLKM